MSLFAPILQPFHGSSTPLCIGGLCGLRHLDIQFYWLCIGLLSIVPAHAQAEELETIRVIAEAEPQTGDVQHEEHAGSYQHINKTELQRQDVNLGDILANEAGIQFRQIGGLGTLTTITMRGASSAQTGVFLDGIKLNSGGNSSVDLSMLDLLSLSSVDVYRGSTPAQLSNASIGGAVNLRSLDASSGEPNTTASLTGGSFNTNRLQFAHQSSHKRWDVVAAASRESSNNRFKFNNDNATPLNTADDEIEKRNNAQVNKISALSRVGYQWNADVRTDALLQATTRKLGIPEWLNNKNNEASYETDAAEFQLVNRVDGIGNWNTSLTLFRHYQNNHYLDALGQVGLGVQDTRSLVQTTGVKSYWEHVGEKGTFSFNLALRNETLRSEDELSASQNYAVDRLAMLSSMHYAYFSDDERLLITPTLRFNTITDNYDGITRSNKSSRSVTNLSPQIGIRFTVNDKLTIRSTLGKFVREPGFSELFNSRGLIIGNSNLSPEKGVNADVGFSYTPSEHYSLHVSAFGSWRDELIALVFDSQGVGRSANIGKANVFGLEIGNDWSINKQLSFRLNTTVQRSENIALNPALDNRELPGEAPISSHAKLRYQIGKVHTWFETNHKSQFYYDQANLLPSKGYWLHNVGIDYQWNNFSMGLTANNISNDSVEDFNGFPRPGRSYYVSLNYRL